MSAFNSMHLRPYELIHIICGIGVGEGAGPVTGRLADVLAAVRSNPLLPITLRCNTDSLYRYQNPGRESDTPEGELFNDRRDLFILQRLGLVPGDTRPARMLFARVIENIDDISEIVTGRRGSEIWRKDQFATQADYAKGREKGLGAIVPLRTYEEKTRVKAESARRVLEAEHLHIRPHHTMCMSCFYGRQMERDGKLSAIEEDNLYEAIMVIQRNPDVPVTLVEGPCMICPPCSGYEERGNLCVASNSMGLRDQKKDLDWLYRMNLKYGDTLAARELFRRLYEEITSTTEICGNGTGVATACEWRVCGGPKGDAGYLKARSEGLGIPG